ncbi:MAG: carboxymuconolactone decarboxylase family protein [Tenericutes bacterium]|nr:carboxymuconolactone decarboxylase family protein [Mycoplasmatota bacterium]
MSKYEKRKYNLIEHIPIVFRAALGFLTLKSLKKKKAMNFKLKERIMLAVTEVNGCVLCSYVHTKLALKSGLTDDEIKELLAGDLENVPKEESLAVLFAKDYAFNKETIDPIYYKKIEERYGVYKAKAILSACEVITMTNSMGIAMGLLKETLTFRHVKGSNILNEILIPILTMVLFPIFLILGLFFLPFRLFKLKRKAEPIKV